MKVIKTYNEALLNAKRFQKVSLSRLNYTSKTFSSFYHWYYFPEIHSFAPSKFIGYSNTSVEGYNGSGNGGITQNALAKYFYKLDKHSTGFKERYNEIETIARSLGKKVSKRVENGSGGIYLPIKHRGNFKTIEPINFLRWKENMKSSISTFDVDRTFGQYRNIFKCFNPKLYILTSISRSTTGFTGITKSIYKKLSKSNLKWCYIVFHEFEKRAYILTSKDVQSAINSGSWRLGQRDDQYKINIGKIWHTKYKNTSSLSELKTYINKYYLSIISDEKKQISNGNRKGKRSTLLEEKKAFLKSLSNLDPTRSKKKVEVAVRKNLSVIRKLKKFYDYRCQFPKCKVIIKMKGGKRYVEVAHIKPYNKGGEDSTGNLLVLCPNHHKEFDLGKLNISKQSEKLVSGKLNGKLFVIKFSV